MYVTSCSDLLTEALLQQEDPDYYNYGSISFYQTISLLHFL